MRLEKPRLAAMTIGIAFLVVACRTAPTPPSQKERRHIVQRGDTILQISRDYEVSAALIIERNKLADPDKLQVGQRLMIPARAMGPESNESAPEAEVPDITVPKPRADDPDGPLTWAPNKSGQFIWPVDGVVVSGFGMREGTRHDGIDIAAPEGTPIWASAKGKVLYAGEQKGYGVMVIVEHDDGMVTLYAHNRKNLVREGARVEQGQPIARVGATGSSASPALHFEIRRGRTAINPVAQLP